MAAITGILCQILTGYAEGAGTDGRVYLGAGGREFRLDSADQLHNDFERGSLREYVLGDAPTNFGDSGSQTKVANSDLNDPNLGHSIFSERVVQLPIYLRFEPDGAYPDWNVAYATAIFYENLRGTFSLVHETVTTPSHFVDLWLGEDSGKMLHLTGHRGADAQGALDRGYALYDEIRR